MSEQPSGLVRIVTGEATAGTGFLVSEEGLIATCAHVLPRGNSLGVEFRFGPAAGQIRQAHIDEDLVRPPDAEDVALLRLAGGVPAGVEPLPLGSSAAPEADSYSTFGFPSTKPVEGMAGRLEVTGRTSEGGFEVLQLRSNEVSRGFSGAPVWDANGAVIGLVVSVTRADELGRQDEVAFIRPVEQLIELCPELRPEVAPPYRGLEVFEEQHAGDYFGREDDARSIVRLLGERTFVAVVGVSGSGKSSLVRAGLRNALERFDVPGLASRRRCVVLPGSAPALNLALALASHPDVGSAAAARAFGLDDGALADLGAPMRDAADRLARTPPARLAGSLRELCPGGLILVVDQFERLFTEAGAVELRTHFVDTLMEARSDSVAILITLRGDFFGHALAQPRLAEAITEGQLNLLRMSSEELVSAIVEPARLRGRRVEPGLAERLIADVGSHPGNLPLLEFALTELWELDADSGVLKMATYEQKLGYEGPDGPVPGVQGAIAKRADTVWSGLSPDDRAAARRALLAVVGVGSGEGSAVAATSRRAWLLELDDAAAAAAEKLVDARLLTKGHDPYGHEPTIEVAHEALIRAWPPLGQWVTRFGPFVRWRDQELTPLWQRWEARDRDFELLLPSSMLDEARSWRDEYGDELARAHRDYIQESIDASEARTARREEELKATRRRIRQFRRLFLGLGVVLVVALVAALAAVRFGHEADRQARVAVARGLAGQAQANLDTRPDLAALLAVEAWKAQEDSVDARDAALTALQRTDRVQAMLRSPNQSRVTDLAFSPKGGLLAAGGFDRTIRLWDLETRQQRGAPLVGPDREEPYGLTFNDAGNVLAAIYPDDGVLLWPVGTGDAKPVRLKGLGDTAADVAFGPNDEVAAVNFQGRVTLHDAQSGEARDVLGKAVNDTVGGDVAFDTGGKRLARLGDYGRVDVWSVPGGDALRTRGFGGAEVWEATLSPALDSFVVIERTGAVRLWDVRSGRARRLDAPGEGTDQAAFSPDGSRLALLAQDGTVTMWDTASRRQVGRPVRSPPDTISLAFSRSGETLATGGDGLVVLWRVPDDGPLVRPLARDAQARFGGGGAVAAATDGGTVAWDDGGQVVVRRKGEVPAKPPPADWSSFFSADDIAFSPDGKTLALASMFDGVGLWTLGRDVLEGPLALGGYREKIAFGPGGTLLIPHSEIVLRLWDAGRGERLGRGVKGDETNMAAIASDPGRGLVASTGYGEVIHIWRVAGKDRARRLERDEAPLEGHSGAVLTLAFDPETGLLASGGNDGTVRLWNVETHEQTGEALVAGGPVAGVAFDTTGDTLASLGQDDGEIRLWDVGSRRDLGEPLPAHAGGGADVVFAGDGGSLLTSGFFPRTRPGVDPMEPGATLPSLAGADWTVAEWDSLLWSADRERVSSRLCAVASRNLRESEWEQFLPDSDVPETCEEWPAGR